MKQGDTHDSIKEKALKGLGIAGAVGFGLLVPPAGVLLAGGAAIALIVHYGRRRTERARALPSPSEHALGLHALELVRLHAAFTELGLDEVEGGNDAAVVAVGERAGLSVRVVIGQGKWTLYACAGPIADVQGTLNFVRRTEPGHGAIGDPDFDETVVCQGPGPDVAALLSSPIREGLLSLFDCALVSLRLHDEGFERRIEFHFDLGAMDDVAGLLTVGAVPALALAPQLIGHHRNRVDALRYNAVHDRVDAVRRTNLVHLFLGFPTSEAAREMFAVAPAGDDLGLWIAAIFAFNRIAAVEDWARIRGLFVDALGRLEPSKEAVLAILAAYRLGGHEGVRRAQLEAAFSPGEASGPDGGRSRVLGTPVAFEFDAEAQGDPTLAVGWLVATVPSPDPLTALSGWACFSKQIDGDGERIGDAAFDRWIQTGPAVLGNPMAMATLDGSSRRVLSWLFCAADVFGGISCHLTAEKAEVYIRDTQIDEVLCLVPLAVAAVSVFSARADWVQALHRNGRTDPSPCVRDRNRLLLMLHARETAEAREFAAEVSQQASPLERILAAMVLGPDIPRLRGELAALANYEMAGLNNAVACRLPSDVAASHPLLLYQAVRMLLLSDIVDASGGPDGFFGLAQTSEVMGVVVFQVVFDEMPPWAADWLNGPMVRSPRHLAWARPHLLAAPRVELEPALIALLATGQSSLGPGMARLDRALSEPELVSLMETLGRIGTVESIPVLRTHCDEFFDPSGPKRMAKAAIAAIQARVKGREVGQLAIVAEDEKRGGLSDTED